MSRLVWCFTSCPLCFVLIVSCVCQDSGSSKKVFKPYDSRLDDDTFVISEDGDPELIIHVPFTAPCKVGSLIVIGGDNGAAPSKVRIFANKDDLDFSSIHDAVPIQEVELVEDFHGAIEYPLKVTQLSNVSHLTLFFPSNRAGDNEATQIFYIGLRGQGSSHQRKAVITVYEAKANLEDHEVRGDEFRPSFGM
eukprot:GDKH01017379.1.p1 GENE.GDKH01017379.1~~GDKH01017379.1.p1  ORF type:complete len:193 (+),score=11.66 GDKH01017379.1:191-769(+)